MPGALEGIRIVDLTNIILGPYGTMLLADQGADVIKVEAPEGDAVRHIGKPGKTPGMGPTYLYVNRNKRSLCLDLKNPAARAALLKVVEGADAFVHALRPQAIEGLGLGYEAIAKIKPDIVYVGAYGFSADGPYGKLPAYDDAIQARFGIAHLMGQAAGDDVPRYPPTILADKTVGLTFAFATLSALMHRQRTGEGQFVEVPMFETMAAWLMVEHLWERTFSDEGQVGYSRLLARTRKPFRTLDGWMAILPYNDKHWSNFFEIVGRPEVLKDPRYSTLNARSLHINDMYAMVEALAPTRTTAEWVKLLDQAQIPNAPVSRPADLFDDPHLVWRQLFKKYPHPSEGEIMMVEPPMRMSRTPPAIRTIAPLQDPHSPPLLAQAGVRATAIEAPEQAAALYRAVTADRQLGRRQILKRRTDRLEQGDRRGVARQAPGVLAARQLEQVGDHVVRVDRAVGQRLDDVAALLQGAGAGIDIDPGAPDRPVVAFAHLGRIGAHQVDMLAVAQPVALDQGSLRERGAGDDVGLGDGLLAVGDGAYRNRSAQGAGQRVQKFPGEIGRPVRPAPPDRDLLDRPHLGVHPDELGCQRAGADHQQPPRLEPRQVARREAGGAGGAPLGQHGAVEQRQGGAGRAVEQQVLAVDRR